MVFRKKRKLSKKELKAQKKKESEALLEPVKPKVDLQPKKSGTIILPQVITARDLATLFDIPITKLISTLMENGVIITINESVDFDTAAIVADELGYKVKPQMEDKIESYQSDLQIDKSKEEIKKMKPRPPVVVVMGHVDHGKTTLLDYIRKAKVAVGEAGGITQHIGAYQVKVKKLSDNSDQLSIKNKNKSKTKDKKQKTKNKKSSKNFLLSSARNEQVITFLDTPGHEAFSSMRAHGANITDIAILVVAADDGVKPQTKEAISHAKAANVPIVVAINKIDRPEANIDKVKRELADLDLVSEEWGGKTIMIPISAKTGKNVDKLLEMLLIVSELEELKANPNKSATGVVIESHMQKGLGSVATVLVQDGTLKKSDTMVVGNTYGKIKRIENYQGKIINEASPSMPVRVVGLKQTAEFGKQFKVVENEKIAKNIIITNQSAAKKTYLSLGEISQKIKRGEIKKMNLILKTDTKGSLEAIRGALSNLSTEEVVIKIIHNGVGDISESDINLAVSTKALVVGFNVKILISAKQLAARHSIKISIYDIIYNLIDDLSSGLSGMLEPKIIEETLGKLKVLKIFKDKKDYKIIGGKVVSGKIVKKAKVKIIREKNIIGEGTIDTLEQNKKSATSVLEDFECGLNIKTSTAISEDDIIEAFEEKEIARKIK